MAAVDEIRASSDTLFKAQTTRKKGDWGQYIRWLLLFMGGILMVMPIIYMLSTSMKWPVSCCRPSTSMPRIQIATPAAAIFRLRKRKRVF